MHLIPHQPLPELTEHQAVEFVYLPEPSQSSSPLQLSINGVIIEAFLLPGDPHWRWRWNTGAAVGRLHLELRSLPDTLLGQWKLLVVPLKMEQQHYAALIDDMQQLARSLIYSLSGGALTAMTLVPSTVQCWELIEERAAIFAAPYQRMQQAIKRILRQPRSQARPSTHQRPIGSARSLNPADPQLISQLEEVPDQNLAAALEIGDGRSMLPQHVTEQGSTNSNDSYEHRLLKRLLERLLREAHVLQSLIPMSSSLSPQRQALAESLHTAEREIRQLLTEPFFKDIGELRTFQGSTALLQRDTSYREIFRMWQMLRHTPLLVLDEGLVDLPIYELPRLYEQWCALQLCQAVLNLGWELVEQQIMQALSDRYPEQPLRLGLRLDKAMLVLRQGQRQLSLRYQPRYRPLTGSALGPGSLDRHVRIPDLTLTLEQPGLSPALLVLDAKYRLALDAQTVPMDALDDAYAYLGALGYAGRPICRAAYILYPAQTHAEHYPSLVGTLPLLPGHTQSLVDVVKQFVI